MDKKDQVTQHLAPSVDEGSDIEYSPNKESGERSFWSKLNKKIEVSGTENLSQKQLFLLNYDLKPVEAKRRKWKGINFVCFWIADSFNISTWQIASTGVTAGLSPWAAWGCVWVGYTIAGTCVTISGRIGTYYHLSFPVVVRSSFGIWGSLWPVFNRVVMSCVWYGVQSYNGASCMKLMLRSIFGKDMEAKIHNTIPESENITSFGMLSFFLFWLFQLPFVYLHPETVRILFDVKAVLCPIAGFAFMIWALVKADGGGPVVHQKSSISGSTYAWVFIQAMMDCLSNFATLITNNSDITRMSKTPKSSLWPQLITLPVSFAITCLIGILVTSAAHYLYGESYWDPLEVLGRFLDTWKSGSRAGVFFISFGFALAQLGTNISANSLSAGSDMTALLPRYINIRRGGFICAAVGFAICPWKLMSSSSVFTTCLSAYSVFLSAIIGVIWCDYFVVKKGYYNLHHLYIGDRTSDYYFWKGFNWRGYLAYICGIAPNITGFVGATGTHTVPDGATKVYYFSFFTGLFASMAVYLLCCTISPIRGMPCGLYEKGWFQEWQEVEDFEEFFDSQMKADGNCSGSLHVKESLTDVAYNEAGYVLNKPNEDAGNEKPVV